MRQFSRCGISCGFRTFLILSALLLLASSALAGSGQLTANPSNINFGSVQMGSGQTQSVTLTNPGSAKLILTQAAASGAGFAVSGLAYPVTLNGGQKVSCNVTFTPQSTGASSGRIAISFHNRHYNSATYTTSLPVSGTGVSSSQLTAAPASLSFGNVTTGSSASLTETLTNSGGAAVTISAATATGSGFSASGLTVPATLNAGQSVSFNVKFSPTSAGGVSGNLAITSNGSNPALNVPLSGTGAAPGQLTAAPASLSFGNVTTGSSASLTETLTNSGGTAVTISGATATGSGFSASGLTLPATLNAGQSVGITVMLSPTSGGSISGNLAITSNATNSPLNISLSGTGVTPGQLTAAPTSLSFSSVNTGSSASLTETVTNSGGSSVTISAATATGAGFSASGLTLPTTLNAGQSASFSVKFSPTSAGSVSGNLAITSNATNSALNVPLSGTGVAPGQLTAASTSLSFGNVNTGSSASLTETVTNSGGASVTISSAAATGFGFSANGMTLPATLNAGQSVSFSVAFSPTSGGSVTGNLAIASNATNSTLNVPLSGAGITPGQLTAAPTSLSFGNVNTGGSASLTETVTNSGGSSVTISAATATGAGFSASGLALPATLNAGQSVSITVMFSPTSGGSVSGNLAITSNATNSPLNVTLSGTGVTPGQLTAAPTSLSFSSVNTGSSASLTETVTNSGGSSVTISAATATGSGFSASGLTLPATLNAGQSVSFSVKFSPTAAGSITGNLAIASNATNSPLNVPLSGTGVTPGQLTAAPASLSFGNVTTGSSTSLSETLTNSGGSPLTISQITPVGTGFGFSGVTVPLTLGAAQSVTFTVSFAPQSAGSVTGSLAITSTGSNPNLSVSLTGTGTLPGQLAVSPTTINFGSLTIGTSQNQTGTLTASNAPVTVSGVGVSGSQFTVSGLSLPITIPAGSSASFQMTFTPTATGAASANATFVSNAANSPSVQSLTGSGTAPQHSVSLGWNTSTSSGVAGYNIYRATASAGPFTRLNSALDAAPYDTDTSVQAGQTYYYVVTAVTTTGMESGYSNEVQVVIPTP
ncbi:MAG TPA: choice-of-anchor D domain-containing protein [Candidatus Sulfotelmatobacter sp.]|nr:choice-of-anchor D domain-containing protein [Candidatus Sulfotelmatobacter sp.]